MTLTEIWVAFMAIEDENRANSQDGDREIEEQLQKLRHQEQAEIRAKYEALTPSEKYDVEVKTWGTPH